MALLHVVPEARGACVNLIADPALVDFLCLVLVLVLALFRSGHDFDFALLVRLVVRVARASREVLWRTCRRARSPLVEGSGKSATSVALSACHCGSARECSGIGRLHGEGRRDQRRVCGGGRSNFRDGGGCRSRRGGGGLGVPRRGARGATFRAHVTGKLTRNPLCTNTGNTVSSTYMIYSIYTVYSIYIST